MKLNFLSACTGILLATNLSFGQVANQGSGVITSTVPFLLISPDARAGGMGDAGVALPANANSLHWNASKYVFAEKPGGIGLNITPWLRQLVSDVNFGYITAYGQLDKESALAGSIKYFSLGQINFTDNQGNSLGTFNPNEFAADLAYARKLSKNFSMAVALRFIYSNLTGGLQQAGATTKPGTAGAGDISAYYQNKKRIEGKMLHYAFGVNVSNIGSKITYTNEANRYFIPTNLRLGGYVRYEIDSFNSIGGILDLAKLLIPTPPIYARDNTGNFVRNPDGTLKIEEGKDPNVPPIQGIIQSFGDAPGGMKEELQEIIPSLGAEYWYNNTFAVRTGYFHENKNKGNRKYLTFGIGIKYKVFALDVSYLAPVNRQRNPLQNTLRFSLLFDFDAFKSSDNEPANKSRSNNPPTPIR